MLLTLCRTEDSINTINKNIVNVDTVIIKLRNDFDLYAPTFILSNVVNGDSINYINFNDINKYYNVVKIEKVNSSTYKYFCEVDVLETYKNEILSSEYDYFREIKQGDYGYVESKSSIKDVVKYESNVELNLENTVTISSISVEKINQGG